MEKKNQVRFVFSKGVPKQSGRVHKLNSASTGFSLGNEDVVDDAGVASADEPPDVEAFWVDACVSARMMCWCFSSTETGQTVRSDGNDGDEPKQQCQKRKYRFSVVH